MDNNTSTALFFDLYPNGFAQKINFDELIAYAGKFSFVKKIWFRDQISLADSSVLVKEIRDLGIGRIVLAGYHPGMYKTYFSRALVAAGKDPEQITLAGFLEQSVVGMDDTNHAKALLACALYKVSFEDVVMSEKREVKPDTLVIGAGIAGIQAALEIADGDMKVYLLERTGTIGGHMAMFDKTFPTLDCAACILTPKMVEVGQNPNIELMTYCEVQEVTGVPGNYMVKILKKARRVSLSLCIGCGTCSEKCPKKVPSEFDAGTTLRKAIYIPFPQAVPNKYLIDADSCTYVENGKCGVCAKVCPVPDCINLDEKDEVVNINVGNIVVATGFQTFDPHKAEQYGYGKFPNVVTSLEFERLVNASGPTGGNIKFRSQDKKGNWLFSPESDEPQKIALIHCIGSRSELHHKYCSKVCCMYSLKLAHLVKEKLPEADVSEYYIDMRAFGKGYEEFYQRIKNEGIHMVRGRTAKVEQVNGKLRLRSEDIENDRLLEEDVDMVVLAVGLEPRQDAIEIAAKLGIGADEDGWFSQTDYVANPVDTFTGGITVAGVCQGPKDIPDTVAQASAAASRVVQSIMAGMVKDKILDIDNIENRAKHLSTLEV